MNLESQPKPTVRPYQARDRQAVRRICADTGFLGNPIDPLFEDRELFADFLTAPYTDAEPENAFVLENTKGEILGFIMGSRSANTHQAYLLRHICGWVLRALRGLLWSYRSESRRYLWWLLFRGRKETPGTPPHGVHFHINLLPEVRGGALGLLLFETFLDRMAELGETCVFGQVVVKGDRRTERMFGRYGFTITERKEVTKFRDQHKEPVFLCTLVQVRRRGAKFRKPAPPMGEKRLLLSLHDFHSGSRSQLEEQMEFCLHRCPGHASVLVVPDYHHGGSIESSEECLNLLRGWQDEGHDLAIHGYYHDRQDRPAGSWWWTKIYTSGEAEFIDLSQREAMERVDRAMAIWHRQGWKTAGFVAPAWLYPESLEKSLAERGFAYTCRLREVINLTSGQRDQAWAGTYSLRSGWRKVAARGWHPLWKAIWAGEKIVRLSLHPHDLETPFVRRQVGVLLEELGRRGYISCSYAEHVQS